MGIPRVSKKLSAFLIGTLSVVLVNVAGMPPEVADKVTEALTWLTSTYLGAQGVADAARDFRPKV